MKYQFIEKYKSRSKIYQEKFKINIINLLYNKIIFKIKDPKQSNKFPIDIPYQYTKDNILSRLLSPLGRSTFCLASLLCRKDLKARQEPLIEIYKNKLPYMKLLIVKHKLTILIKIVH